MKPTNEDKKFPGNYWNEEDEAKENSRENFKEANAPSLLFLCYLRLLLKLIVCR